MWLLYSINLHLGAYLENKSGKKAKMEAKVFYKLSKIKLSPVYKKIHGPSEALSNNKFRNGVLDCKGVLLQALQSLDAMQHEYWTKPYTPRVQCV